MAWLDEFALFLHRSGALRFGEFTLSSGKKSPYYADMRIVPSHPAAFRGMIREMLRRITESTSPESFDALVAVPTGGLVVGAALALEAVKPLIYVRAGRKEHGRTRTIEGDIRRGARLVLIDDVATSGGSIVSALGPLRESGYEVQDAWVIIDREEGAAGALGSTILHSLATISEIADSLYRQGAISGDAVRDITK